MLLVGALPRVAAAAWAVLAVVVVVGLFGELFRLPERVRWISPLEHLAMMPAAGSMPRFVAVTAAALGLAAAGLTALRDRDLPACSAPKSARAATARAATALTTVRGVTSPSTCSTWLPQPA